MTDFNNNPILHWLFQKFQYPPALHFAIDNDFTFDLLNRDDANKDLFHYNVSFEGITLHVSLMGIDTPEHCDSKSNIDLVYFVWKNFLRFSYKKFAMALSPRGASPPKFVFLKHYSFQSDEWRDSANCDVCVDRNQELLLPFHGCDLSLECKCKMCTRQPPSLADSAHHVLFNYSLHIDRFQLESDTPHDLYVFATHSLEVPLKALLPPEEPMITLWYSADIDSPFRYHRDCLGAGTWLTQSEKFYHSQQAMVDNLVRHRNFSGAATVTKAFSSLYPASNMLILW